MKNRFLKIIAISILMFSGLSNVYSQSAAACNNAQNICNNPSFPMTVGGTGLTGLAAGPSISNPFTNPQGVNAGCMFANSPGPNWMILTVSSSGMLGFSFGAVGSANPQLCFYDWIMWPYTPTSCAGIFANTQPPTACNWNCTSTGGTGMGNPTPGATACNFQPSIPVTAGQQFVILFSNYCGVNGNVTIANNGTAGLTCSPMLVPSATACPNQAAVVTATWNGVSNISYTINPGNVVQTSPNFTVSSPVSTTYTVLAQATNTSNSVINTQTTFSLTISPNTTLAITNPTYYCSGSNVTFTVNPAGATAYSVDIPAVGTQTFANSPISIPGLSTPSTVVAYSITATYSTGCIGTGTTAVAIAPNYSITVNTTSNVCQGDLVNLTASLPTATAYAWSGPNAFSSNTQNPNIPNIQQSSSGVYTVSSNIIFNGIQCPRVNTTSVSVVPINTINVTPNFTLCQGGTLNLNANASGAVSYSWNGPPAFNSLVQNPTLTNMMPTQSGNYDVTAFFTDGVKTCSSTAISNVSVVPTFPVAVTVPNNICQYTTANISALAPTAIGYSWVGPNNFTSNLQATSITSIMPVASGMYFSTATFAIGTVSCTITGSNQINVVPVNPVIVTPTVSVCEPSNVQLSASSNGAATYSWTGPNNYTALYANPTMYFATPSLTGVYTVVTSYNNGALTCYNSNTTQVTVNPKLTFTLDAYKQMCYNTLLNVNGPVGATSYSWTSSTGFTSNSQNLTIPGIQPNQSGTYTLNVSLGPCISTQKIQIDVLTPLAFTLTPESRTICRGDSVKLVAGSIGGSQNYAYVWTPGVFLGSPTGSVQYGHPIGTTIYNLAGYDIACPNYTVFHTFTVQVNQPPMPDLQLEKAQGCQPLCLFYDTKTQNEAAITTYNFGGTQIMQADSFYYCLDQPGTYNLKITSLGKNGCSGVYDFPVPIVVFPKPQSDFDWTPDVVTTSNNQVTFNPTAKYGPITSLNWMFTGTGIDRYDTTDTQTPQRVFENTGKFPVMLVQRTDKGCIDTVIKIIEVIDDFNVYIPNAFTPNGDGLNDVFLVKGLGFKLEGFSMEIFDRWGNALFFSKDLTKGWDGTVKSVQSQDGVYIYKIKAVGANGEGRKEYVGHVTLMK
ncbi:MAG: gliding motility-associated C-terminal domain-containing protein [Bacteroidota bacterium]|nr:gliding motility-associated C-terminal domain-containing protein [Bacteroidota bacterium]MDP3145637.1 gliding motility-associated C-terminal domain-containing protein [Bacteroidota bacterium]